MDFCLPCCVNYTGITHTTTALFMVGTGARGMWNGGVVGDMKLGLHLLLLHE